MTQPQLLTPTELHRITTCSLQHHFWQQSPPPDVDLLDKIVLETIAYLHASGGPRRLNLPATLRQLGQFIPSKVHDDTLLLSTAQQMLVNYHRRLRQEWPKMIASNELLGLNLRLKRSVVRCEGTMDRLDQEEDGGITVVSFITETAPMSDFVTTDNIQATMLHALTAAAYPHKRPVRLKRLWLAHDQVQTIELAEKVYRHNLERMRERVQNWLNGETLARPGLYCDMCPFQYQGCPIYTTADDDDFDSPDELESEQPAQNDEDNLSDSASPATLSSRQWTFLAEDNFDETQSDT